MDAQPKQFLVLGHPLGHPIGGLQKLQKTDEDCFSVKSYKGLDFITLAY